MMCNVHFAWAIGMILSASALAADQNAADNQARYRRLDRLQALGVGLLNQHVPNPPAPQASAVASARTASRPWSSDDFQRETIRKNAESAAKLNRFLDKAQADCGGKLMELPEVGMSDEAFRMCTLHARIGGLFQVVVSEDGTTPLRLYVFTSERAHKVYTIGGVVTAIEPR